MRKSASPNLSVAAPLNSYNSIRSEIEQEMAATKKKAVLYSEIYPQILEQLSGILQKVESNPRVSYSIDWDAVRSHLEKEQVHFVREQLERIKEVQLDAQKDEFYKVFYEVHESTLSQEAEKLWVQVRAQGLEKSQWKNFIFIKMK